MESLVWNFNVPYNRTFVDILHRANLQQFFLDEKRSLAFETIPSLSENRPIPCDSDVLVVMCDDFPAHCYLQSWRYFLAEWKKPNSVLKTQLSFAANVTDAARKKLHSVVDDYLNKSTAEKKLQNVTLIGIHIRRGDLINGAKQDKEEKYPADPDFLYRALHYYRQHKRFRHTNIVFIALGSDPEWNRKILSNHSDVIVLDRNSSPAVDLCILSLCNHTVYTVGTFGWWAGFLSGGMVVYQKKFAKPGTDLATRRFVPSDHYLPEWIPL